MQHWQTYYNQNKHLPLHKIMEGYHQLLNEYNERMVFITQQSHAISAGPGGSTVAAPPPEPPAPSYLVYTPDEQTIDWYAAPEFGDEQGYISLQAFQLIPPASVYGIYIDGIPKITSISNLGAYQNLWGFDINTQLLTSLDVSGNPSLYSIGCGGNQLTSLDISNNLLLNDLSCQFNQLTSLDVSNNIALKFLFAGNNQLTQTAVDQILIDLAANATTYNLTGGQVYLNGAGNAARSSASNAARTTLLGKGWTVATN